MTDQPTGPPRPEPRSAAAGCREPASRRHHRAAPAGPGAAPPGRTPVPGIRAVRRRPARPLGPAGRARRGGQGRRRPGRRRHRPARSPCSAAATCCSRACPASPRRCSCAPWPRRSTLDTKRVQFTPDLMPGDVTGSLVYDARTREFDVPRRARSSPTCCWPTRSTARRPRPSRRCSRRWRSGRSPSTAQPRPLPDAVHRRRHPEPGRVRGHLPAARGPARPVPAQAGAAAAAARRRDRRCCAGTRAGFDPRDLAAAGIRPVADRRRPRRRRARRCARCAVSDEVRGLHRRHRPGHPGVAVARSWASRRVAPPRCWRPAGPGPGCPAATFVTPDDVKALAHADPGPPALAAARGRARGRRRRRRARRARSARCPSRADGDHLARRRAGPAAGWHRSPCGRTASTVRWWLLLVRRARGPRRAARQPRRGC